MISGEIGRQIYLAAYFDLSDNTSLVLEARSPSGETKTLTPVSAPAIDSPVTELGILPANTYGLYVTTGDEFDVVGDWELTLVYEDATPKKYFSDCGILSIEGKCT